MMKRIFCLMVVLVFLGCFMPLAYGAITFRIGDRDGFGFSPEELIDAVAISGAPADTDGDGKLEPGEFLPEINGNCTFDECPPPDGDGFDHRSEAEMMATNGAQFTDVSFRTGDGGECLGHIPMNTVFFEFDTSVLAGLPIKSAKLRIIYADFDGDCPDPSAVIEPYCYICTEIYADGEVIGNVPLTSPRQGGIGEGTFDVPVDLLEDGLVTITFESKDSIEFDVAILKVKLTTENVKPLVRLRVKGKTADPTPVPGGPAGTVTVNYRLRNKSDTPIFAPFLKFLAKQEGILLLNADGGPSGSGASFTLDVGTDLVLAPGEKVLFSLVIGLTAPEDPDFNLRVMGVPLSYP